jgi:hypothetical protein
MGFVYDKHVTVTKDGRELTVHCFIVKMSVTADPMALVLGRTTVNVV